MAGGWPDFPRLMRSVDLGTVSGSSDGVAMTTGGNNIYGSWTQIIASTPCDISHLLVELHYAAGGGITWAADIAVAPSGSEGTGTILSAMMAAPGAGPQSSIMLPVAIRAGSRIAGRAVSQSFTTQTLRLQLHGFDTGFADGPQHSGTYDTFGYPGTGTVTGIAMDPGAVANTKGTWTQITASAPHDLVGFFLTFDCNGSFGSGTSAITPELIDIGLGASGSEQVVVPNLLFSNVPQNYSWGLGPAATAFIHMPIRAGTRVAARCQCPITATPDRKFGLSFHGLRA